VLDYIFFLGLVFVTDLSEDFSFLACSINLQWNERNEKPIDRAAFST